jgi:dCMP deaminase
VGALLVDPVTNDIIQTGYNGAPSGQPGCLSDSACPRGRHYEVFENYGMYEETGYYCACAKPWPCPDAVAPSSSYDTGPGSCIAIHAEANCLLRAGTRSRGAWMYVSCEPCDGCRKLMAGAGVTQAHWYGGSLDFVTKGEGSALRQLLQRLRRPGPGH